MRWAQSLRRWTMRGIHATILGAALAGSASIACAQVPGMAAAANLPKQDFARKHSFDLPVVMDQEFRATLSEIRLYVKTPTGNWKLHESIAPNQTRFSCKVAQDGEYWFMLATVDRSGRMSPTDPNIEAPKSFRRVVVDTTPPTIQVQPWTSPEGDFCLRCIVQDANPDYASLKAGCRTSYGEVLLERHPTQAGVFCIKGRTEPMQYPVVVRVSDMAGNEGSKEVNVGEMLRSTMNAAPAKAPANMAQTGLPVQPVEPAPVLPAPRFETATGPLPSPAAMTAKVEAPAPTQAPSAPPAPRTDFPMPPAPIAPAPIAPPSESGTTNVVANKLPAPAAPAAVNRGSIPHQLINTTHAKVDFRLDDVGPSGIGKVEIYYTADKGQTWVRHAEHADKRSPLDINLPHDGEWGIRIAVTNGNGFGGKAPVRGDVPHCTIEVDTTAPFVQLRSTELVPSAGHVELKWNAQDKNLGAEPVTLLYRTKADGPWQVIARNVKNDGVHQWAFPRDVGSQFFFKIEVTDLAGNLAQDTSRQPVLIDMSEPRVSVVGVTGTSAVRPVSGGGN